MSNIGWSTLSVIPSAKGFGSALTKGIAPEMALAGKSSGLSFSTGLLAGIGSIAAVALGVAVVATKMGAAFQSATTLLVTGAGESEKSIGLVRDGLLKMAPAVGIGPTALAKAMFMVESAGYHGAAGLTVMKAAAEGAKIGGADATVVANGLTTALTDYHLPASQAAVVTSKLVATVAAGKTTMQDLSAALSTILPFASSFGVSLNDITGAMATMTGEGIDAATSATMLKFTMMSMANETPKGLKALASIGMTAQQLKDDLSTKGVGGALQIVTDMVGKKFPAGSVAATHAIAAIVGGTRGMGSALALTGTHAATLTANIKSIGGASTEAGGHVKGWATTTGDLNFQIDRGKAWISALAITIGNDLIPYVTKGVKWFNDFVVQFEKGTGAGGRFRDTLIDMKTKGEAVVGWLKDNTTAVKAAAIVVGVLTLAVQAHNVAMFISSGRLKEWILQTAIVKTATAVWAAGQWILNAALTANPIGLVVVGIGLLVAAIIWVATKTTWFQTAWQYMTSSVGAAWRWLWNTILAPVFRFILDGVGSIIGGISNMLLALGHVPGFGWATTAGNAMKGAAAQAHALANGITDIPNHKEISIHYGFTVSGNAPKAAGVGPVLQSLLHPPGHALGGLIGGTGSRDTEPAMLTPGEFVVRRDGSNISDALNHFGAKAVTPAAGFDYDRMAAAMSRAQIVLDGKNVARSVDQRLAPR